MKAQLKLVAAGTLVLLALMGSAGLVAAQWDTEAGTRARPAMIPQDGTETLPPGASIQTVLPGMQYPVAMAFDPQGRLFYTQKRTAASNTTGLVRLYENGVLQATPVMTFTVDATCSERGLLGITLDPNFSTNHYVYVYYTALGAPCGETENRVVRFTENNGVGSNPVVIFSSYQSAPNHDGGNIHFGPDGKLYITVGENANPANSQNVTTKNGKLHRINSDGTIPPDNPVFTQTGALPSLYAIGLRNSFDFTLDPVDTVAPYRIFASENGPSCDDELNRIEPGYNYGWRAGYPCDDGNPSPTYNTIPPLWYLPSNLCCEAPTGIEVYDGWQVPQWTNELFMVSYGGAFSGRFRHYYLNADRTLVTQANVVTDIAAGPMMDIETGPDGALYYIEGGGYTNGTLKRIVGAGGTFTPTPAGATATRTPVAPTTTVLPSATRTPVAPSATRTAVAPTVTLPVPTVTPAPPTVVPTSPPATPTVTGTQAASPTRTPVPPTTGPCGPLPCPPTGTVTALPTTTATVTQVPPTATPCTISFSDVPPSQPFYVYIRCLACRGIISGYADGTFQPGNPVTRGQAVKMIANAAGIFDAVPSTQQTFTDVPPSNPFWVYIERLAGRGYISGYGDGTFRPQNTITRGQFAKVDANAAQYTDPIPSNQQTFADVPTSDPFWLFIERVAAHGIISGYGCDPLNFNPCSGQAEECDSFNRPYFRTCASTTRGQGAKIVANTFFPGCETPGR